MLKEWLEGEGFNVDVDTMLDVGDFESALAVSCWSACKDGVKLTWELTNENVPVAVRLLCTDRGDEYIPVLACNLFKKCLKRLVEDYYQLEDVVVNDDFLRSKGNLHYFEPVAGRERGVVSYTRWTLYNGEHSHVLQAVIHAQSDWLALERTNQFIRTNH